MDRKGVTPAIIAPGSTRRETYAIAKEQTHKSPEAFGFGLRERESFVRWPSKAVDRATCRSSTALEGHRTENLCVCSIFFRYTTAFSAVRVTTRPSTKYNRESDVGEQVVSYTESSPCWQKMVPEDDFQRLIQLVRQGDERAAEAVVRAYEPHIRRVVRIRMEDPALRKVFDSMDICQSVLASFFLRAATGQYEINTPAQLIKLLAVMTRNKLQDRQRKQRAARRDRRREIPLDDVNEIVMAGESSPSKVAAAKELYQRALELMTDTERKLVLQWAAGASWGEIAKDEGKSPDAMRMRMRRCVDRVARQLEG